MFKSIESNHLSRYQKLISLNQQTVEARINEDIWVNSYNDALMLTLKKEKHAKQISK